MHGPFIIIYGYKMEKDLELFVDSPNDSQIDDSSEDSSDVDCYIAANTDQGVVTYENPSNYSLKTIESPATAHSLEAIDSSATKNPTSHSLEAIYSPATKNPIFHSLEAIDSPASICSFNPTCTRTVVTDLVNKSKRNACIHNSIHIIYIL